MMITNRQNLLLLLLLMTRMAITITAGDVADADFLLLLFFGGDENNQALSSSTLLNVCAGILLGGRVEFSGVKILLKVS